MATKGRVDSSSRLLGPRPSARSKKGARMYFFVFSLIFFVLFLVSVIALGAFGVTQKRVADFASKHHGSSFKNECILFSHSHQKTKKNVPLIELSNLGVCAYVLWGQVSILIVSFVWLAYSVVLLAFGPKLLSPMRILDFLVLSLTCVLSFTLSVTITAGLGITCNIFDSRKQCSYSYLTTKNNEDVRVHYYHPLHSAESSSWVATAMLCGLSIWNLILVVIYCKSGTAKPIRGLGRGGIRDHSSSEGTESSESSQFDDEELLTDVVGSSVKKSNPFTNT